MRSFVFPAVAVFALLALALALVFALSSCAVDEPAELDTDPPITGACVRAFRPTLEAWELQFGRVPASCAFLDVTYDVQLVAAGELPCAPGSGNETVVSCTQPNARVISLLASRSSLEIVNSMVHEWIHAISYCVRGELDLQHLEAKAWASYGGNTVEAQALAGKEVGECL